MWDVFAWMNSFFTYFTCKTKLTKLNLTRLKMLTVSSSVSSPVGEAIPSDIPTNMAMWSTDDAAIPPPSQMGARTMCPLTKLPSQPPSQAQAMVVFMSKMRWRWMGKPNWLWISTACLSLSSTQEFRALHHCCCVLLWACWDLQKCHRLNPNLQSCPISRLTMTRSLCPSKRQRHLPSPSSQKSVTQKPTTLSVFSASRQSMLSLIF